MIWRSYALFCFIAAERQGTVEDFLYDVDLDGSSLLHLAANSGVLGVSMRPLLVALLVAFSDLT